MTRIYSILADENIFGWYIVIAIILFDLGMMKG